MTSERRYGLRRPLHGILLNKYVGGFPYAVRLLDISETGARVRCLLEPDPPRNEGEEPPRVALELEVPGTGDRLWLWAREIWRDGKRQALAFSGLTPGDRAMLRALLRPA
jgi:hypothetical protein